MTSSNLQHECLPSSAIGASKESDALIEEGSTPRTLDNIPSNSWANLSIDASTVEQELMTTPSPEMNSNEQHSSRLHTVPYNFLFDWYTSDLKPWQSEMDLTERRLMVQRIITITRSKLTDSNNHERSDRTTSLAKQIELSLYSRAGSLYEYRDLNTLRRRLQSLVSMSFYEAAVSKRFENSDSRTTLSLGKRKKPNGFAHSTVYRKRSCYDVSISEWPQSPSTLFSMGDDLLTRVFSFLSGRETLKCMTISNYAAKVMPSCVYTLSIETKELQRAFEEHGTSFLCRFPNLARLDITNRNKKRCDRMDEARASLHGWNGSPEGVKHDEVGEQVILQLVESLHQGACRFLKELRLISAFNNTCRLNALHALCRALVQGVCPELEDLLLGGNCFSDFGTVDVAWLLRSGSLPNLRRLDIRRNFIGEAGLKRIMTALSMKKCKELRYLYLGGNIITDNCVQPMVEVLSGAACPHMRFLGLEDNFLSTSGVHSIIRAAVIGGMMPKLHQEYC